MLIEISMIRIQLNIQLQNTFSEDFEINDSNRKNFAPAEIPWIMIKTSYDLNASGTDSPNR